MTDLSHNQKTPLKNPKEESSSSLPLSSPPTDFSDLVPSSGDNKNTLSPSFTLNTEVQKEMQELVSHLPEVLHFINKSLQKETTKQDTNVAEIKAPSLRAEFKSLTKGLSGFIHQKLEKENREIDSLLPFEPYTFFLGLIKRLPLFFILVALSLFLGIFISLAFRKVYYEAESVLVFKSDRKGKSVATNLKTFSLMVAIPENLEKLKQSLHLTESVNELTKCVEVQSDLRSSILQIKVRYPSATLSTQITNLLSEIFIENQLFFKQEDLQKQIQELKNEYQKALEDEKNLSKPCMILNIKM